MNALGRVLVYYMGGSNSRLKYIGGGYVPWVASRVSWVYRLLFRPTALVYYMHIQKHFTRSWSPRGVSRAVSEVYGLVMWTLHQAVYDMCSYRELLKPESIDTVLGVGISQNTKGFYV